MRFAYPEELGNINELMESFKERLRSDYRISQSKVENMTCNKPKNIPANDVINLENSITNYQSASVYLNIFSTQNNYLIDLKKKLENLVKNRKLPLK
ncbi:hypothetical protein KSF78_0008488 [Schistosoma japonicum]|nr:hypothetical protein KSF78_0008488 [Schistosoma japonicum]